MKKLIFIPFLYFCLVLSGTTYYVSPTGNDSDPGTFAQPWKTWGKAFNWEDVVAGDTVYFRGGVYIKNNAEGDADWYYPGRYEGGGGYAITRDGTIIDTLCYFAYPGDADPPILDCINTGGSTSNRAIRTGGVNYVRFKGLHIRNVRQDPADIRVEGVLISGNNVVFENCTFYNMHGHGCKVESGSGTNFYFINCDAHNCCDSLSTADPGNDGTGFSNFGGGSVYYQDCRAWLCGDQGFSTAILASAQSTQYTEYESCWSFNNGMIDGGGSGYKMGWIYATDGNLKRQYTNCIAAYNRWNGWKTNDYSSNKAVYVNLYNNTSYHNGHYSGWPYSAYGFEIHNTSDIDANELKRILKNNISYDNEDGAISLSTGALYTHETNSWDTPPGITLTDADFLSTDSTGITAARQADGSLPDNDCYNKFLRLSSTSLAYQAGTDVGLTYDAVDSLWRNPPSIGAYEYYEQEIPEEPKVLSDLTTKTPYWQTETTATSGGNVYDAGGGTVSARGVCWNTTGLPTTADDKTEDGTGTGEFWSLMTGLSQSVTYYVRAYATNEIGTAYGNQMTFRTSQVEFVDGKPLVIEGKALIIP